MFAKTPLIRPRESVRRRLVVPEFYPSGSSPDAGGCDFTEGVGGPLPDYNFGVVANWFITVNNFRSTMTPWSPVDQQLLSNWNYYTDIYRVYAQSYRHLRLDG